MPRDRDISKILNDDGLVVTTDVVFDTSTLFVDSDNNRVGIGETSPDTLLHISGAPDSKVITFDQSGRASAIGTYFSSNGNDSRLDFFLSSGSTDGTSNHKMSLKANGHLGLGITSPQSVLTVVQSGGTVPSGSVNGIVVVNNNTTSLNSHLTLIGGTLGDSRIEFGDVDDRDIGMIQYVHNGNYMTFVTNTASALTLDSSQNATFGGDIETDNVIKVTPSSLDVRLTSDGISTGYIGTQSNHPAVFMTNATTAIYVDTSQNVGIGTTSPDSKLHVFSGDLTLSTPTSGSLSTSIVFKENTGSLVNRGRIILNGSDNTLTIQGVDNGDNFASAIQLEKGSSSGVCDVTVPQTLNVEKASTGTTLNRMQRWLHTSENTLDINMYGGATDVVQLAATNGEQNISIVTDASGSISATNTKGIYIESGGNVGIGTTSPASLLHISSGTSGDAVLTIEADTDNNNEADGPYIDFKADGGINESRIGHFNYGLNASYDNALVLANAVGGGGIWFYHSSTNGVGNLAASDVKMIIADNTSIGTTTATTVAKFDVRSTGAAYNSTPSATAIFRDSSTRGTVRIRSEADNSAELFLDVNGASRWDLSARSSSESYILNLYPQAGSPSYTAVGSPVMTWAQAGNVGIGSTSPVTPLEIRTTNKLGSTFTGTTNGEGLTVTQTNYTAGNYISLVEAAYDDGNAANPNVRIGAYFDSNGSKLVFGTSNSYGSGITNTALVIDPSGDATFGGNVATDSGYFVGTDDSYLYQSATDTVALRVGSNGPYMVVGKDMGSSVLGVGNSSSSLALLAGGNEAVRIMTSSLRVGINNQGPVGPLEVLDANIAGSSGEDGFYISTTGQIGQSTDNAAAFYMNDSSSSAGTHNYIIFRYQGTTIGDIDTTDNSTIRYNTFTGAHWAQFTDHSQPDIKLGTVMSTINEMCNHTQFEYVDEEGDIQKIEIAGTFEIGITHTIYIDEDGTQAECTAISQSTHKRLAKVKVSDTAGDKSVYGVFAGHYKDGDSSIESLGLGAIRIGSGVTVENGDLLESAGDGTARPQTGDTADLFKASTIAKVTSTVVIETYDDGSFTVPCTLHCG